MPSDGDASAIGRTHLLSWQQTYPSAEHGVDAAWISEHLGDQDGGDHRREDATLEALYLLRDHQGTGLGDQLMAAALGWLGDQAVRLEVASDGARALGFYERHGFHRTGEAGLFGGRIPVVAMRRSARR